MKNGILKKLAMGMIIAAVVLSIAGCSGKTAGAGDADSGTISDQQSEVNAKVRIDGSRFTVDGKEFWINGANTPWHRWNDFTGNMDGEFWDKTFETLAEDGINCTRIWINCAGEGVVRLAPSGKIISINEEHWTDLDKLFELAEKHKVYIMPTLLSFDHCKGEDGSAKKWRALIQSKENCDLYAENYVKEFCRRYGENEYLFGIDIMNEPDWVYENEECGKLPWDNLSYLFGKCAEAIHETCSTPVTVGYGMIKYNSDKYEGDKLSDEYLKKLTGSDKAHIDFYSTHYYMWEKPYFGFPFSVTPKEFGLATDKPCIIGETENDDEKKSKMTLTEKYQSTYDNGWNGIMVWMQTEEDESWYRYDLTKTAVNAMAKQIPEKIDPLNVHGYTTDTTTSE